MYNTCILETTWSKESSKVIKYGPQSKHIGGGGISKPNHTNRINHKEKNLSLILNVNMVSASKTETGREEPESLKLYLPFYLWKLNESKVNLESENEVLC